MKKPNKPANSQYQGVVVSIEDVRKSIEEENRPEAVAARLAAIKALIKLDLEVYVENIRTETLIPATVVAIDDESFTVVADGRKTVSRWEHAKFVTNGAGLDRPVLFDSNHYYAHL